MQMKHPGAARISSIVWAMLEQKNRKRKKNARLPFLLGGWLSSPPSQVYIYIL